MLGEYTETGGGLEGYRIQAGEPGGFFRTPLVSVACIEPAPALRSTQGGGLRHGVRLDIRVDRGRVEDAWREARRAQGEIVAAISSRRAELLGAGTLEFEIEPPEPEERRAHLQLGTVVVRDRYWHAEEFAR